jgi:transcriptional regulator with XRE-family HTH domain
MERRTNGATVRALREALGISQSVLAARCKISKPFVSMIENSVSQPSAQVARALATELAVPLDAITYPWQGAEEFGDEPEPAKAAS